MGDLCEVVLAHGSLFDGERTVIGRHDVQSVTANGARGGVLIHDIMLHLMCDFMVFLLTFPAGSLGNWEYWDPGGGGAR